MIVQTDLKQFYDRVTPDLLRIRANSLKGTPQESDFFEALGGLFQWEWHGEDKREVVAYARSSDIPMFDRVSLPQGLVSAGFFANIVLLEFDEALRAMCRSEILPGIVLYDVCRYVDDLRLTISAVPGTSAEEVGAQVAAWLNTLLNAYSPGLLISPEKTKAALFRGDEQPLARQGRKMQRIQSAISGGFDAAGGEEVIQAVQGLVRSQAEISAAAEAGGLKTFTAVPDVRDETIGRFAAGRFRTTFRSLRPLLEDRPPSDQAAKPAFETESYPFRRSRMSQPELDDEARAFSYGLINTWIRNPSNVRLMRVAVDLWPTPALLEEVLSLFQPYLRGHLKGVSRKVAFYCLSELFRAGATETGIVKSDETLPGGVDLTGYRRVLGKAAESVAFAKGARFPWYLRQQALLFLMVHPRPTVSKLPSVEEGPLGHYAGMISFLDGDISKASASLIAVQAIVARRSFYGQADAAALIADRLDSDSFAQIAARDLEFARELYSVKQNLVGESLALSVDLGTGSWTHSEDTSILKDLVGIRGIQNVLRNEIGVLSFSVAYLREAAREKLPDVITPSSVQLRLDPWREFALVSGISFNAVPLGAGYRSIYAPPSWAGDEAWRFKLGFLLRYILTGKVDFSKTVRSPGWRETVPAYRPATSHWMQRLYGFYNGHDAFGDDWLPISQFTQDLLYSLLAWPGCRAESKVEGIGSPIELLGVLESRLQTAKDSVGAATGLLMLRMPAPNPGAGAADRPLRACVVQSITPEVGEISADLTVSGRDIRRKHRNHLSTALAAVEKMLELRDTHVNQNNRLDWLIFPELSVHPDDVQTHLVPFARAYRTVILAGMTYEQLLQGEPLVNSALWIVPRKVEGRGLQVSIRRQGKGNLAKLEEDFNDPVTRIMGFRPCQWLIGYNWSADGQEPPLWLTSAICYDATDLGLASDLRGQSDVFAIPALNQDVGTFDHMAQALHYHMYQLVLVANNGSFGGSNAHVPCGEAYQRQVFHTHGQPQATISFLEVHNVRDMKLRRSLGRLGRSANQGWKFPPAGFP
ncbi:RNA-directed DNA polymerase [Sphingomonas sp.]|uniref:RNA-directed DNA polymerase n=1 Tax=Sphingomonas sp. TaxID=28214 RepID=UPI003B3B0D61